MNKKESKIIKAYIIDRESLLPLIDLTNKEMAKKLGFSLHIIKNSLAHHGLYKGKVYTKECPSCKQNFSSYLSAATYCSNNCKYNSQAIWNRGKSKKDCDKLLESSQRMRGNKLGKLVNHSAKDVSEIILPKTGVKISYDNKSMLEKEWLMQIDGQSGVLSLSRSDKIIPYINTVGALANYYPDFEVRWETGLKWLVEIKELLNDDDYQKISYSKEWCVDNGYQYRLITTGMVKNNTWTRVYSHPKNLIIPSLEFVMMNHAATWRALSTSTRLQVGAVISTENLQNIESYGYNGDEKGGANCPTTISPGMDGFIHAEENALLKCKTKESCVMFVTDSPCINCAKRIINSGNIKEVYYVKKYRDMSGVGLLVSSGIRVYHFQVIDYLGRYLMDDEAIKIMTPMGLSKLP